MRVALVFTTIKEEYFIHLKLIVNTIRNLGWSIVLEDEMKPRLMAEFPDLLNSETFNNASSLEQSADLVLSLGGDGTFLKSVVYVRNSQIPILGINMGRLGFLANVSKEFIEQAFDKLAKNEYHYENRTLLQIETANQLFGAHNFALNELTIHKKDSASMISVEVDVAGKHLNTYWADGLIISTPTGSTAYSLSCGGPIISPESPVFAITPIAPHNLNVRPIIIRDDLEIKVRVNDRDHSHLLTLDSRSEVIEDQYELTIRKAPFTIKTIQFSDQYFFDTIRDKLLWGLDRRN
jgi:NAD+ kinase